MHFSRIFLLLATNLENMISRLLFFFLIGTVNALGQIGFAEHIITGFPYMTQRPSVVRAADFDGDGDIDLVTQGNGLNWYENIDGQGNFGLKKSIHTQITNWGGTLETADFDGDGDIDILASYTNKLNVFKNDGQGNFTLGPQFTIGATYSPLSALPVDVNNDGHPDILAYYNHGGGVFQGAIVWYQNDGLGNFGAQQIINNNSADLIYGSIIWVDDLDNDNDLDIILGYADAGKIAWFKNTGNATYSAPILISTAASGISSISTQDMDNDGDRDIVATQRTGNEVVWYKNLGNGNFADELVIHASATSTYSAFVADLNNDQLPDVVYSYGNIIGWQANNGGTYSAAQDITAKAHGVRSVIMADIDGDGMDDLVSASYDDDKMAWYKRLDNAGNFGRQLPVARALEAPNYVYTGDFDGDGDLDVLANSQHDAKLTWLENVNGIGFFGKEHIITENVSVGNTTPIAYPGDFDGDGDLDIASRQGSNLLWYANDGQGNFTENLIHNNNLATILRAGDLDGDGDLDLLTGQYNNDKLSWYENLGGGNFGPEQTIYAPGGNNGSMTSLQLADMDGDGDLDFIVSSYNSYTNFYKNVDGQGTFVDQNILVFDWLMSVFPADMDGDGDLDVVGVDSNGGGAFEAVVWYENDGQGNFENQYDISTLQIHGQDIWAADMDNDGDIDVLTAAGHSATSGQLAWYPNNGDGSFADRQMIHEIFNNAICESLTVGDINGDGKLDVVAAFNAWGNVLQGKISVFENLGPLGNSISGVVTLDTDSNGCTEADIKGANMMVVATGAPHSFATFTDGNGAYEIPTTAGNFTVAINSQLPSYYTSNPAQYDFNFIGLINSGTANFCVAPIGTVNDLVVSAYPMGEVRPGFPAHFRIVYRNNGTTTQSGTVNFTYDPAKLAFDLASVTPNVQSAGSLSFDFAELPIFAVRHIDITFTAFAPPVTNNGDELQLLASIESAPDQTPEDNTFTLTETVVGSYDPNDIRCLEGDQVGIADAGNYLHYIIRFQNTGSASAINVRVENPLDAKLDWTSMQLEGMSHPGRVEIIDGNNLRFIFNNIHLAASSVDEPASHGFIAYKIKPLDVAEGDIVQSVADIYFDFNPAITTNTAETEFVGQLSVPDALAAKFSLYPNPVSSVLNIASPSGFDHIAVMDFNGRVLKTMTFNEATEAQLDLSELAKGIYLVKVEDEVRKVVKGEF